jgi:hypothetical protein
MITGLLALFVAGTLAAAVQPPSDDDYIEVKVCGIMQAGMMAIGGETTGYTITARGLTWELDLGKDPALRKEADRLGGRRVVVEGTLEVRKGVEIAQRQIVTVKSLAAVSSEP